MYTAAHFHPISVLNIRKGLHLLPFLEGNSLPINQQTSPGKEALYCLAARKIPSVVWTKASDLLPQTFSSGMSPDHGQRQVTISMQAPCLGGQMHYLGWIWVIHCLLIPGTVLCCQEKNII